MRVLAPTTWSLIAVALAGAAPALGTVSDHAPPFQARPGAMEFSGRLIAHARVHAQPGAPSAAAALLDLYHPIVMPELDEYVITVPAGDDENSLAAKLLATDLFDWVRPDWTLYPVSG